MRQRDRYFGQGRLDDFTRAQFVGRVGIGVEKTDCDCLESFRFRLFNDRDKIFLGKLGDDRTVPGQTLAHLMDIASRHELLRFAIMQLVQFIPVTAGNGIGIADASGHDQHGLGPAPFEESVQTNSGAVDEEINFRRIADELLNTLKHPKRWIFLGCRNLADAHRTSIVLHYDIREGPANISRHFIFRHPVHPIFSVSKHRIVL